MRIKVFRFPVCSHEASRPLKVGRLRLMLLLALDLSLDPGTRLAPLVHELLSFLVDSLLL